MNVWRRSARCRRIGRVHWREETFPEIHEPLIDHDTFDRAQALLKERGEDWALHASNRADFLLTGPSGPVEVRTVGGNTSEVGGYLTGAIIIPVKPLEANASYTAEVALAPYGELPAESHRWTFQTGPANPNGAWPTKSSSPRAASRQTARISRLRIAPAAFPTVRRGRRHTTGALVTYLDSAKGTVTFGVNRLTSGIVIGGRCAAAKGRTAHKRRCTRYTRVYSINHNNRPGKNSFRLTGRYGHRRLAPGRYQLAAIGSPANATFTVTR